MRLGIFLTVLSDLPVEQALDKAVGLGVQAVEIATGNYPGDAHCKPDALIRDPAAANCLRAAVETRGLTISALSQHGNPLHPNPEIARRTHETWRATIRLAEMLDVPVVNAFSGCPGDHDGAQRPNWVACSWPTEYEELLAWQWEAKVLPYWVEEARYAAEHGITVGMEMHPGFVVYNPDTLLRLRAACGASIAANFDPSHLFWQGIDPAGAIRRLADEGALAHVHAKDTYVDAANVARAGVLETRPAAAMRERSWMFRTVGLGHGEETWHDIVSTLHDVGYDGTLSIEHEDRLLTIDEGLEKAATLLTGLLKEWSA